MRVIDTPEKRQQRRRYFDVQRLNGLMERCRSKGCNYSHACTHARIAMQEFGVGDFSPHDHGEPQTYSN